MTVDTESGGLLNRLPAADRAELQRCGTRRRYRAGAPLFHEGDPSDWVAVVLGGRVKVSAVAGDGKEVVLAVCSSGDVLGELSAIDGLCRSATATAVDTVEALVVPVDGFRRFLARARQRRCFCWSRSPPGCETPTAVRSNTPPWTP